MENYILPKSKCQGCEEMVNELHDHHVIPRSQGGSNGSTNVVRICGDCHFKIHHPEYEDGDIEEANKGFELATKADLFSEGYGILPNKVARDNTITAFSKILYCELSSLSAERGYCWATNKYLASKLNTSTATISRSIGELQRYLAIEDRAGSGRKIWVHTLQGQPRQKRNLRKIEDNLVKNATNLRKNVIQNSISNTIKENTVPSGQNFEEFMEAQGYKHDSIVDSDGGMAEWWEDESGRKLSKSELKSLRAKWRPPLPSVPEPSLADTDKLVEVIKKTLEKQYGTAPVIGNEAKAMIRQNLIKKYDKDFIREYAQWYFVDSQIDKKWRFSIQAFVSERFINSYLSEQ